MKWASAVGGVALTCIACIPSRAADITPVGPAPLPAAPTYIPATFYWSGFYAGATLGGGFGTASLFDPFAGQTSSASLNGFLAGGYLGANYQFNSLVVGFEGDFIASWAEGTATDVAGSLKVDVLSTIGAAARVGWAIDRLLIFAKAGAGFVFQRDTITASGAPATNVSSLGLLLGGGVDWALSEHWIARVEYEYLKIPAQTFLLKAGPAQVSGNLNELRGGIAYKF
jgi:outer membrane immunogenic protein